jgi:hypothetical protein
MPSAREDYLLRMIQQLGVVLARLRERLTGLSSTADATDAAAVDREAYASIGTLLGPQAGVLNQLDADSAARLLGDADRVSLWVAFLRIRAEAQRTMGRPDAADRLATRAEALERVIRERNGNGVER